MNDSYQVLGVARNATDEEIKARFRKLAMEFHPDRHVASSKSVSEANAIRFREISEAYERIGDKEARRAYDAARSYAGAGGGRRGGPFGSPYGPATPRHSYYHGENPYGPNFRKGSGFRARPAGATSFSSQLFTLAMRSQTLNLFLGGTAAFFVLSGAMWDYAWRSHNQGRSWREVESKLVKEELEKYRARAAQAARADAEAQESRASSSTAPGTGPVPPPPPPPSQPKGAGVASPAPPGPRPSVATPVDRAQQPEAARSAAGIASTSSAASQSQSAAAGASLASGAGGGSRRQETEVQGASDVSASHRPGRVEAGSGGASVGAASQLDLGLNGAGLGQGDRLERGGTARATAGD